MPGCVFAYARGWNTPEVSCQAGEQLDAKSADIKALFNNTLDPVRATELREKMLRAGLPI